MIIKSNLRIAHVLAVAAVAGTLLLVSWRVFIKPMRPTESSGQIQILGEQEVAGQSLHTNIVAKILDQIQASGAQVDLDQLQADLSPLIATVTGNYLGGQYVEHFIESGIELNSGIVEARLDQYRKGPYRDVHQDEWDNVSLSQRYGLVIGSGERRGAGWRVVGLDGLKSGLSRNGWPSNPEGMKSAISFSGFSHPKEVPELLAWVDLPVEFDDSTRCLIRLLLRWDDQKEVWVPYAGVSYTYGGKMPFIII